MIVLPRGVPIPHPERPATQLLHDNGNARLVAFTVAPGQVVKPHTSRSTVVVHVLEGSGPFSGADGTARLTSGDTAVYPPGEMHGMEPAEGGALRFLAIITPAPDR